MLFSPRDISPIPDEESPQSEVMRTVGTEATTDIQSVAAYSPWATNALHSPRSPSTSYAARVLVTRKEC